jgi:CRP/FNR family transcriptional regulator, anaerobic regulatory protein
MNHYYEKLFAYVAEIQPMSDEAKARCRLTFNPIIVSKDTIIEAAGTVPKFHNFIVSGYMRNFHTDKNDNEITTDLNDDSRFFTSYFHFMNQTISNENIHCITDCELLRISFTDATSSMMETQERKDYSIKLFQNIMSEEKQRIYDFANLTAEQRYQKFLMEKPNIIQNVPLNYIASYLGITQRHLSRIRAKIST